MESLAGSGQLWHDSRRARTTNLHLQVSATEPHLVAICSCRRWCVCAVANVAVTIAPLHWLPKWIVMNQSQWQSNLNSRSFTKIAIQHCLLPPRRAWPTACDKMITHQRFKDLPIAISPSHTLTRLDCQSNLTKFTSFASESALNRSQFCTDVQLLCRCYLHCFS